MVDETTIRKKTITYGLNVLAWVTTLANKRVDANSSDCPPLFGDVSVQVLTGHVEIVGCNGILFPVHGVRWHNLVMAQDRLKKGTLSYAIFRPIYSFMYCQSKCMRRCVPCRLHWCTRPKSRQSRSTTFLGRVLVWSYKCHRQVCWI